VKGSVGDNNALRTFGSENPAVPAARSGIGPCGKYTAPRIADDGAATRIAVFASATSSRSSSRLGTADDAEIECAEISNRTRTVAKRPSTAAISAPSVAERPPNGQSPAPETTGGLACRERPL